MRKLIPIIILLSIACSSTQESRTTDMDLIPLRYNNPGLIVDLGVGLWAWPLPMDFDRDGDMDLLVSCPDTPFNGLYFFENKRGQGAGMPVFEPPVRVGEGKMNLQVSHVNGESMIIDRGLEYQDFTQSVFEQPEKLYPAEELEKEFVKLRFSQWKYADYENDGDLDLIVGIDEWGDYGWDNAYDDNGHWMNGPLHGYVFLIENSGGEFINRGKIQADGRPVDVYGAPTPNMEDFDGDGDLDLVCGEFLDRFTWFENVGTREKPVFSKGRFLANNEGIIKMDLEMIIPSAVDWDGDGDVDLVVGDEDGRVALLENTGTVKDNMPEFLSPAYFQQHADLVKFGALATPFAVDWDEDGDQDLICGNTAGHIGFIENLDGGNPPKWNKPVYLESGGEVIRIMAGDNGSIQGPAEKKWGYTSLSVADWDGDGLHDIIVNSIWGKIQWFKNVGSPGHPVLDGIKPVRVDQKEGARKPAWNWWNPEEGHLVTQWRTTPYATDWNGDGLNDLLMLDPEGYLSFYERYEKNGSIGLLPGKRIFYGLDDAVFDNKNNVVDSNGGLLRLNNKKAGGSGRRKFCVGDWDQDGDTDLLVNSINTSWFENTKSENGKVIFKHHGPVSPVKLAGHTTSPTIVDWDKNGIPDLLIGAEDGHFYYLQNRK